jgi:hypothetical protein
LATTVLSSSKWTWYTRFSYELSALKRPSTGKPKALKASNTTEGVKAW